MMKVKEESEKVGLKLNIQKTQIMEQQQHFMMLRDTTTGIELAVITNYTQIKQQHCL